MKINYKIKKNSITKKKIIINCNDGWCTSDFENLFAITVGKGEVLELWDKWAQNLFCFQFDWIFLWNQFELRGIWKLWALHTNIDSTKKYFTW